MGDFRRFVRTPLIVFLSMSFLICAKAKHLSLTELNLYNNNPSSYVKMLLHTFVINIFFLMYVQIFILSVLPFCHIFMSRIKFET